MADKKPETIAAYIKAAPPAGQAHLNALYAILKAVAPKAGEAIKWGQPFLVEPRFLFAFSAHKSHLGFTSSNDAVDLYRNELSDYEITRMGIVKIPYNKPLPEATIKKIAKAQLKRVNAREGDTFW